MDRVMNAVMAPSRHRLIIDTTPEIHLAVKLAATRDDLSISEFVNSIFRKHLADEIKIARQFTDKGKKKHADD